MKHIMTMMLMVLTISLVTAQTKEYKTYVWDYYKTRFQVPSDFEISESTKDKWAGGNSKITLSIYPRKIEGLSVKEMPEILRKWTVDNGVKNIGSLTELDEEKLNGYVGVLYEGEIDEFPVGTLLINDPDYPDIYLFIWIAYHAGYENEVIDILMSFTPN